MIVNRRRKAVARGFHAAKVRRAAGTCVPLRVRKGVEIVIDRVHAVQPMHQFSSVR